MYVCIHTQFFQFYDHSMDKRFWILWVIDSMDWSVDNEYYKS